MEKIDREKELNKLAEKLGLNKPKIVKCISCKKKIKTNDCVILTKNGKTIYLCNECYEKLEKGELVKNDIDKILEKMKKMNDGTTPYIPNTATPNIPNMIPNHPDIIPLVPNDYSKIVPDRWDNPEITWTKLPEFEVGTGKRYELSTGTFGLNDNNTWCNSLLKIQPLN